MEIIHGGDIYTAREQQGRPILDFSVNINPLGMPQASKKAIIDSLDTCDCYPDPLCRELRTAIANYENVPVDWILCGNGAADLIYRLVFALKPNKAMVLSPTFAEYELALTAGGCFVDHYDLDPENGFVLDEGILDVLDSSYQMLFVCNPNNPTGQVADNKLMIRLLNKCQDLGIILFVDECFNSFLDDPEEQSMKESLNGCCQETGEIRGGMIILKAFTKYYGMAGVRLGYILSSNIPLINQIAKNSQPWSVSIPAQAAGIAALTDKDYRQQTKTLIREERTFLKEGLNRVGEKVGLKIIGSEADYVFFHIPTMKDLKERLLKRGILIRSCANYRNLGDTYYRIGVKSHRYNQTLIQELESEFSSI